MKKGKALLRKCIYIDNGKGKIILKKFLLLCVVSCVAP